jgi:type II secretory pathway pseudopilin PulG
MMNADCRLPIANCQLNSPANPNRWSARIPHFQSAIGNRQSAIRPAFTFIEVLFATILLGIGFIMIAAVFPVAIQQTAAVSDETQSTALARDAIKKIQAIGDALPNNGITPVAPQTFGQANTFFQPTYRVGASGTPPPQIPVVAAFSYGLTQALATDSIFSQDRRFGWVGFYRRDSFNSPFAQVFVIALENPNFANYISPYSPGTPTLITGASLSQPMSPPWAAVAPPIPGPTVYDIYNYQISGFTPPTGAPALIPTYSPTAAKNPSVGGGLSAGNTAILMFDSTGQNPIVEFPTGAVNAATGTYLLIADDGTTPSSTGVVPPPPLTGRFLKLGAPVPNAPSTTPEFYLQSGYDFTQTEYNQLTTTNGGNGTVDVFLVGRAPTGSAGNYTGNYTGPNQDIGVATGYVRVNTANN